MTDNLNVNDNLSKWNAAEEFREEPPGDTLPLHEEITISKTEVKEEVHDFGISVDHMEHMFVKEEYMSSPEDNFERENLMLIRSKEESTCENFNNMELMNAKQEYISLPENNFTEENSEVLKTKKQLSNKNLEFGNCKYQDLQDNKYRCELCHSDFDENIYFKKHCEQCPFTEQTSKERAHLNNADENYECAHCAFSTSVKSYFVKHIRIHTKGKKVVKLSEESKKYKCKYCKYVTYRKLNLDLHIRTHTKEKPYKCTYRNCKCTPGQEQCCKCDVCGYAAAQKSTLKRHILVRHSGEQKRYKCRNCDYAAHGKTELELHIHRVHTNTRPFKCTYKNCKCTPGEVEPCKCDMCGYEAVQKYVLKSHILQKHSGEKKYKCNDCKYATNRKSNLEQHIRSHTNDKAFKCSYKNCKCTPEELEFCNCNMCEYAALQKYSLRNHISENHSGEPKKYKCSDCEYANHRKSSLEQHILSHSNDRSFKCTYKNCQCTPEQKES